MSSFTGVSVITDGKNCTTTTVDTGTDSGYHLLVVKDYPRTVQEIPNGESIVAGPFIVGGHQWCIWFYPNGMEPGLADFISVYISLDDASTEETMKMHCLFSFVNEVEYQKLMRVHATEPQSLPSEDPFYGCAKFVQRDALERSTHLKNDFFTIRCDIMVCKDHNMHDIGGTTCIGQHLDTLLQNKVGADVTFEVSGEAFVAHRCVLAARSTVFMAQLFGSMKEGTTSSVIQIKDMRPKVFAALLKFIYMDSFPEMEEDNYMKEEEGQEEEEGQDEEEGQWLQDLLLAANRYDLQRLNFLCGKHLSKHIGVSSVASLLALAEQHHCHGLKEACFNFIQVQSPKCLDNYKGVPSARLSER